MMKLETTSFPGSLSVGTDRRELWERGWSCWICRGTDRLRRKLVLVLRPHRLTEQEALGTRMGCPLVLFLVLLPVPLQERCRVMIKRASWLFFNQYYLSLKAGARGSPVNVSFGQESPGTKQGTTTRISRNWFKMSPLRRQRERQKSERLRQCSHYTGSDLCRHENHTG